MRERVERIFVGSEIHMRQGSDGKVLEEKCVLPRFAGSSRDRKHFFKINTKTFIEIIYRMFLNCNLYGTRIVLKRSFKSTVVAP